MIGPILGHNHCCADKEALLIGNFNLPLDWSSSQALRCAPTTDSKFVNLFGQPSGQILEVRNEALRMLGL